MYEGLRLTELHEEWAIAEHTAREAERRGFARAAVSRNAATSLDAEIRRRVAAQEIGPPYLSPFVPEMPMGLIFTRFLFGIPDAERRYPGRNEHWSYHERHAVLVPTCHLCQSKKESPQ